MAQEKVMVCMDYNGMTTIEDMIRGRPTWEGNEKDAIKELKKILKRSSASDHSAGAATRRW